MIDPKRLIIPKDTESKKIIEKTNIQKIEVKKELKCSDCKYYTNSTHKFAGTIWHECSFPLPDLPFWITGFLKAASNQICSDVRAELCQAFKKNVG